jgi:hypothetical protein
MKSISNKWMLLTVPLFSSQYFLYWTKILLLTGIIFVDGEDSKSITAKLQASEINRQKQKLFDQDDSAIFTQTVCPRPGNACFAHCLMSSSLLMLIHNLL